VRTINVTSSFMEHAAADEEWQTRHAEDGGNDVD
jgi:hypothetical protein